MPTRFDAPPPRRTPIRSYPPPLEVVDPAETLPPVKRDSDLTRRPFPFELLHTDGPATNMRAFHWHDFMELSFIRRGRGIYEIEGKTFDVRKGDVVIINNVERHRVTYDPADPLYETVMHFAPELLCAREDDGLDSRYLRLFLYDGATFSNKPELPEKTRRTLARIVGEIRTEYLSQPPWHELMVKSKILTLVTHLLRHCGLDERADPDGLQARRRNIARLESILSYIRDNFRDAIRLEDIARRFSMNPSYFSDYFRRNLGVTFTEHLLQTRVHEAIRLLDRGRLGSTEIAFASGFGTTASFYRAFKKVTGANPGDYRRAVAERG